MNLKNVEGRLTGKQRESALNAQGGYLAEQMLTRHIRYYIGKRKKGWTHHESLNLTINGFAASKGNSSRYRPSKIKNEHHPVKIFIDNFGRDEFDLIQHDTKHAASAIINFIHKSFGEITSVFHTGIKTAGDRMDDVLSEITNGRKTNADVVVHTNDGHSIRIIGKSIKYSTSKSKLSAIKLFAPTPNKINSILDEYYEKAVGHKYEYAGVASVIARKVEEARIAEANIYYQHDEFLYDTFGEGLEYQKNKKFVKAIYDPNKLCALNDHALSYIRLLVAQGNTKAKEFYDDLLRSTSKLKKDVATVYFKAITEICDKDKKLGDALYRELAHLYDENYLYTLVVYIKRKNHSKDLTKPDVVIYNVNESIETYLRSSNRHEISMTQGTGMFRFGNLKIEADMRPGKPLSRGIINITHDAKALLATASFEHKDWPLHYGKAIAPRARRRLGLSWGKGLRKGTQVPVGTRPSS